MAINATIQVRRGLLKDFDPTKMLPGEWAVSIDSSTSNQIVWMCFAPGVCKRMGTYEDFQNMVYNATGQIIERYEDAFGSILEEVNTNAEAVSANTDIVLVAKSDIINTYLPQIKSYVSNASASASNAKTYSENAKASASEADKSAEDAKKYSEQAFSTTPDGYEALVDKVDVLENAIVQTSDRTLYGSKAGGIKLIGIKGASEQKQYSGAQLLDLSKTVFHHNGATLQYDEPSLTLTKTMLNLNCFIAYSLGEVEQFAGKTIYMSGSYKGRAWRVALGYAEPDNTNRIIGTQKDGTTTEFSNSMLVDADTYAGKELLVWFYVDVLGAGAIGDTGTYTNIMVSTEENADYEPYVGATPSPNPFYPQEIESVGDSGSLTIKAEGKNLAHENYIELYASNDTKLVAQSTGIRSLLIKVKPNTTYLLGRNGGTSHGTIGYLKDVPKVGDSVNVAYLGSTALRRITTLEDTNYILWYIGTSSAIPTEVFCYETTDTTAEYEPYRSKSITIPLNEPLRGIGEVKDEIVQQDGVCGVLRRIVNIGSYSGETITTDYMSTTGQLSNGASVNYVSTTPTFEPFTDQTPFYGLESFDTVTYISTDSEVEPSIELKFAKTEGDAVTLLNYNGWNLARLENEALKNAVLSLGGNV